MSGVQHFETQGPRYTPILAVLGSSWGSRGWQTRNHTLDRETPLPWRSLPAEDGQSDFRSVGDIWRVCLALGDGLNSLLPCEQPALHPDAVVTPNLENLTLCYRASPIYMSCSSRKPHTYSYSDSQGTLSVLTCAYIRTLAPPTLRYCRAHLFELS